MSETNPLYIASIEKAFRILELFDTQHKSFSFTELSEQSGLNKSAVQRYIYTLEQLGYIEKNSVNKRYELSIKSLFPASAFLSQNVLIQRASPYIVRLREKYNARFGLSVMWQDKIVYLIELHSHHQVYSTDYPGFSVPIYCTTSGRMFLSQYEDEDIRNQLTSLKREPLTPKTKTNVDAILDEIKTARSNGFCLTDEEYKLGHINVGFPVYQADKIIACVVAVLQKTQWDVEKFQQELMHDLLESSRVISEKSEN